MNFDCGTEDEFRTMVIALYAGAEAQKRVDDDHEAIRSGASDDDERAESFLSVLGDTEEALRKETAEFVTQHWALIEMIAKELQEHETLVADEADILYSIYCGEATLDDLSYIRARLTAYHS